MTHQVDPRPTPQNPDPMPPMPAGPVSSAAMTWFARLRLRVLAVLLAAILAAIGLVTWLAVPAWPVIGVTLVTVAAVVNSMTTKLSQHVCRHCGTTLQAQRPGVYGVICDSCGSVNETV